MLYCSVWGYVPAPVQKVLTLTILTSVHTYIHTYIHTLGIEKCMTLTIHTLTNVRPHVPAESKRSIQHLDKKGNTTDGGFGDKGYSEFTFDHVYITAYHHPTSLIEELIPPRKNLDGESDDEVCFACASIYAMGVVCRVTCYIIFITSLLNSSHTSCHELWSRLTTAGERSAAYNRFRW